MKQYLSQWMITWNKDKRRALVGVSQKISVVANFTERCGIETLILDMLLFFKM